MARVLVFIYILLSLGRCVLLDNNLNFYFSLFERKLVHKMVMDANDFTINSAEGGFSSIRCAANCFYDNNCIGFNLPNCQLILDSMVYQTQTRDCENCKYYEMTCNELCRRHSSAFVNNELPNSYSSSCDCIINVSSSNSSNSTSRGSLTSISEITSEQTSTSFAITTSQISSASPNTFLSSSTSTARGSSATLAIGTNASTSENLSSSTDIFSTTAIALPSTNDNLNNENQLSSTTTALTMTIPSTGIAMTTSTTTFTTVTTPNAVTPVTIDTTVTTPTTDITAITDTTSTIDITVTTVTTPTTFTTSTSSTTVTTPATSTTVTTPTTTDSTTLSTSSTSTTVTTPATSTTVTTPTTTDSTTLSTLSTSTRLTTPTTSRSTTQTTPTTTTTTHTSTSTTVTTPTTHTTAVPTTAYVAPSNLIMSLTKTDWSNCPLNCNNMNHATLPLVKTTTKQTEIANFIENKGSAGNGYWIGTHITMSGVWVYEDNSSVSTTFRPWGPGAPAPSMTCIRAYIKYEQPTAWYCDGGNTQYYYICDQPAGDDN